MSSLAIQSALRARLIATPAVAALVPADKIIDQHRAPDAFPCIIMGTDFEAASDLTLERRHIDVVTTLHVWDRTPGLTGVKGIAFAIRSAIEEPLVVNGQRITVWFASARYLRDKDGVSAHGVITLECRTELV